MRNLVLVALLFEVTVRGLVEAFQRAGYFRWTDRYGAEVTDVPSATWA